MKPNHLIYDNNDSEIDINDKNNLTTLYHPFPSLLKNKSATLGDIFHITTNKMINNDDDNNNNNNGMVSIDDDELSSSSPSSLLSSISDFDRFMIDNGSGSGSTINNQQDSTIEHQIKINSSSASEWNDWIPDTAIKEETTILPQSSSTTLLNLKTVTMTPMNSTLSTPTSTKTTTTKLTNMTMTTKTNTTSSTKSSQIVSSSLKKQLLISNTHHHLNKHNSSFSKPSNWLSIKPNIINMEDSLSTQQSSEKNTNHLTTIATIANSFSAAFLPTQLQSPSSNTINRTVNSSIDYVVETPPHSLTNFPTGFGINGSGEDDDYLNDWSTNQEYQFMINLSIGGIIITTFILLLFLIWLCCSKNDRDQYSIRKVPNNHNNNINYNNNNNNHHHYNQKNHYNHRLSINSTLSDNNNINSSLSTKRQSNCSLYISNPNSEDSQQDIHGVTINNNNNNNNNSNNSNNNNSIIFHNQLSDYPHYHQHYHHHNQQNHQNYYHFSNKPITTIIKQFDVNNANDDNNDQNNNNNNNNNDVQKNQKRIQSNNNNNNNIGGKQMAKNLAAYCENQQQQIINKSTKNLKKLSKNSNDLKSKTTTATNTMTIYDYYDNNNDNLLICRSRTLPWPSTNNEIISYNNNELFYDDNNKNLSFTSLFTNSSNDMQVNFTKKRRNRMHNDSAAAIALNRSGILQINNVDDNKKDKNYTTIMNLAKASPNALLSYYEKMTKTNFCDTNNDNDCMIDNSQINIDLNRKRTHQNSPETSSGDSIIIDNNQTMADPTTSTPPIVVYNQRTAL